MDVIVCSTALSKCRQFYLLQACVVTVIYEYSSVSEMICKLLAANRIFQIKKIFKKKKEKNVLRSMNAKCNCYLCIYEVNGDMPTCLGSVGTEPGSKFFINSVNQCLVDLSSCRHAVKVASRSWSGKHWRKASRALNNHIRNICVFLLKIFWFR